MLNVEEFLDIDSTGEFYIPDYDPEYDPQKNGSLGGHLDDLMADLIVDHELERQAAEADYYFLFHDNGI